MELEVPGAFPKESVPEVAKALNTYINKTAVVMIVKQHENDLNKCEVRVVRRDNFADTMTFLLENGYSKGNKTEILPRNYTMSDINER